MDEESGYVHRTDEGFCNREKDYFIRARERKENRDVDFKRALDAFPSPVNDVWIDATMLSPLITVEGIVSLPTLTCANTTRWNCGLNEGEAGGGEAMPDGRKAQVEEVREEHQEHRLAWNEDQVKERTADLDKGEWLGDFWSRNGD
ncbi:hypothetical protein CC1G_14124 [Coprinopsis cinerea okayama7|uniref:Uncharacterized protein n=1 Tax=Coprinopsis cinerea (strain Okayama-7 / 130 / ATCC MYA-4618 / FGSC 9003) TaxID=240176 RepID=D6RL57_COPC7|nr:hypothetical protein CC1G_14124 [Coprinopsis cinerea okayama7\|eukprot:XP_002911591.1 hypothetical protein CC1G_14124 [Coprinopsis cinerea okayama7\